MSSELRASGEQVLEFTSSVLGACPGGREAAPELFAARSGEGPAFESANSAILSLPDWAGAAGAILSPVPSPGCASAEIPFALLAIWIAPRVPARSGFPSQLALDLPVGRYAITTYDSHRRLAVGSEWACGSPVLCGPPFDGAALAVLVRPLRIEQNSDRPNCLQGGPRCVTLQSS